MKDTPVDVPVSGDLDLPALWAAFMRRRRPAVHLRDRQQHQFLQSLRETVSDPDNIDDVRFCGGCRIPGWQEDMYPARVNGGIADICESCRDNWAECRFCELLHPDSEVTDLLDGETAACERCRIRHCSYCEVCDGWYPDGNAEDHDHDDDDVAAPGDEYSCCRSPLKTFAVRNDGGEPLASDTRTVIGLPAGVISEEGLAAIQRYMQRQHSRVHDTTSRQAILDLAWDLDVLGNQWQTRTGNYPKRLSRHAYEAHHVKLTPEVMSEVGVIARDHSKPVSVAVEITRDLNQGSSAFYNAGSCWWGSDYGSSRCALKTSGGFALRTFDGFSGVAGRAWVMPLRRGGKVLPAGLEPTFETMTPAAFVVFNGYGDLAGYAAPRIMAHLSGWTYRKINFRCEPMYINSGGYLVAPEPLVRQYENTELVLRVSRHSTLFADEQAEKEKEKEKETADVLF